MLILHYLSLGTIYSSRVPLILLQQDVPSHDPSTDPNNTQKEDPPVDDTANTSQDDTLSESDPVVLEKQKDTSNSLEDEIKKEIDENGPKITENEINILIPRNRTSDLMGINLKSGEVAVELAPSQDISNYEKTLLQMKRFEEVHDQSFVQYSKTCQLQVPENAFLADDSDDNTCSYPILQVGKWCRFNCDPGFIQIGTSRCTHAGKLVSDAKCESTNEQTIKESILNEISFDGMIHAAVHDFEDLMKNNNFGTISDTYFSDKTVVQVLRQDRNKPIIFSKDSSFLIESSDIVGTPTTLDGDGLRESYLTLRALEYVFEYLVPGSFSLPRPHEDHAIDIKTNRLGLYTTNKVSWLEERGGINPGSTYHLGRALNLEIEWELVDDEKLSETVYDKVVIIRQMIIILPERTSTHLRYIGEVCFDNNFGAINHCENGLTCGQEFIHFMEHHEDSKVFNKRQTCQLHNLVNGHPDGLECQYFTDQDHCNRQRDCIWWNPELPEAVIVKDEQYVAMKNGDYVKNPYPDIPSETEQEPPEEPAKLYKEYRGKEDPLKAFEPALITQYVANDPDANQEERVKNTEHLEEIFNEWGSRSHGGAHYFIQLEKDEPAYGRGYNTDNSYEKPDTGGQQTYDGPEIVVDNVQTLTEQEFEYEKRKMEATKNAQNYQAEDYEFENLASKALNQRMDPQIELPSTSEGSTYEGKGGPDPDIWDHMAQILKVADNALAEEEGPPLLGYNPENGNVNTVITDESENKQIDEEIEQNEYKIEGRCNRKVDVKVELTKWFGEDSQYHFGSSGCLCIHGVPETEMTCKEINGKPQISCRYCNTGFYLTEDKKCQANVCSCENGKVAQRDKCYKNGIERCEVCNPGYHKFKGKCVENQCVCNNGRASFGIECTRHNSYKCIECNDFYYLKDDNCLENWCHCPNGIGGRCEENGKLNCKAGSCNTGYHFNEDDLSCDRNECICHHGEHATGPRCTVSGSEICERCVDGYHLTEDFKCVRNRCLCPYGIPTVGRKCIEHNEHRCARKMCNTYLGYRYDGFVKQCIPKLCTCTNGQEETGPGCTNNGDEICQSCNDGLILTAAGTCDNCASHQDCQDNSGCTLQMCDFASGSGLCKVP